MTKQIDEIKHLIDNLNEFEKNYLLRYLEGSLTTKDKINLDIEEVSKILNIDKSKISIVDGLVNVDSDVYLNGRGLTELPFKFGKVTRSFYCSNNNLTSLKGAPQEVGGYFDCSYNKLTTLEGAPQTVTRSFDCRNNNLTSLKGAPQTVGGGFYCMDNYLNYTEKQVRDMITVKNEIYGLTRQNQSKW